MTRAKKKQPRAQLPANLKLARSGVHGYGIFARDFIAQGTRVIEYVGERISKAVAYRREEERLRRRAAGEDACVYVFEVTKRYDIDGDVPWNIARRINHSCGPNCEIDIIRGHIWIIAKRDIAPGEELNYNYHFDFCDWREHPCWCGAEACVGYIVNPGQRWRVRRILEAEKKGKGARRKG